MGELTQSDSGKYYRRFQPERQPDWGDPKMLKAGADSVMSTESREHRQMEQIKQTVSQFHQSYWDVRGDDAEKYVRGLIPWGQMKHGGVKGDKKQGALMQQISFVAGVQHKPATLHAYI